MMCSVIRTTITTTTTTTKKTTSKTIKQRKVHENRPKSSSLLLNFNRDGIQDGDNEKDKKVEKCIQRSVMMTINSYKRDNNEYDYHG